MFNWRIKPNPELVPEVDAQSYYVSVDFTNGSRGEWPDVELVEVYDGGMVSIHTTDGEATLLPVRNIEHISMMLNTGAPDETE